MVKNSLRKRNRAWFWADEVIDSFFEKVGGGWLKALHFHWKMPQLHIEDKSWHFSHLPHHHLQGDPKSRIFLVRAQQVRSARAFSAAPAPLSPCPAPAGCSCSCGTGNQRLSPDSGENPPSPCSCWVSPGELMVLAQLCSSSSAGEGWAGGGQRAGEVGV